MSHEFLVYSFIIFYAALTFFLIFLVRYKLARSALVYLVPLTMLVISGVIVLLLDHSDSEWVKMLGDSGDLYSDALLHAFIPLWGAMLGASVLFLGVFSNCDKSIGPSCDRGGKGERVNPRGCLKIRSVQEVKLVVSRAKPLAEGRCQAYFCSFGSLLFKRALGFLALAILIFSFFGPRLVASLLYFVVFLFSAFYFFKDELVKIFETLLGSCSNTSSVELDLEAEDELVENLRPLRKEVKQEAARWAFFKLRSYRFLMTFLATFLLLIPLCLAFLLWRSAFLSGSLVLVLFPFLYSLLFVLFCAAKSLVMRFEALAYCMAQSLDESLGDK